MPSSPVFPPISKEDLEYVWSATKDIWHQAKGCNIFITGGTGFFGVWLLESLSYANEIADLDIRVTVLSRDPKRFLAKMPHLLEESKIEWIQGDVQNFEFPRGSFDSIIHAATDTASRSCPQSGSDQMRKMIKGTSRVLEFAMICQARQLLFTSSGAVYGNQPTQVGGFSEDFNGSPDPLVDGSAYGIAKRSCEYLCFAHGKATGCNVSIARCFAFVGPHLPLDQNYAIGNFIRDGISGRPIQLTGDGQSLRSYMYAADLAIWLWTLLFQSKGCQAYNVGSSNAVTILDLAKKIADMHGLPEPKAQSQASHSSSIYVPNISKAQKELGLKEYVSLTDAVQKTSLWHSNQKS
jgi:dTDP-glucose 4,6-dehydratase